MSPLGAAFPWWLLPGADPPGDRWRDVGHLSRASTSRTPPPPFLRAFCPKSFRFALVDVIRLMIELSDLDMQMCIYKNNTPVYQTAHSAVPPGSYKVQRRTKDGKESNLQKQISLVQLKFRSLKYLPSGQKSDKGCITEEGKFLVFEFQRLWPCLRMEESL